MELADMRSVVLRGICLAVLAACALPAEGAIKTVVRQCDECATVQQLENEAWAAAGQNIENTTDEILFLIVSDQYPISAYFRLVWASDYVEGYGAYKYPVLVTETVDEQSVIALENMVFSRAAKTPPIAVPGDIASSVGQWDAPEILIAHVQDILQIQNGPHFGPWHGLFTGNFVYFVVRDMRTLELRQVFVGDTITVVYPDGSSEKLKFLGIGPLQTSIQWEIVLGSQRDANGNPIPSPDQTVESNPVQPGIVLGGTGGGSGGTVVVTPIQFCEIETWTCRAESWETGVMFSCHRETYRMPC